ncbi:MAG TPA: nicotinate-nucleotide diphosphorylase (carboxylating), partial [Firmicutes bacterium]|nr:nicotinate-nucleotide diphosphorylase (carboxylating) [Bacillota bacterium]
MELANFVYKDLIRSALAEDLGTGDLTSALTIPANTPGSGRFMAKANGVICGWSLVQEVFHQLNPSVFLDLHQPNGAQVQAGDLLAVISGPVQDLLSGERVALNFL